MSNNRYHSLDSLRGLASLQVVIGHCLVALPGLSWLVYQKNDDHQLHDLKFYIANSPIHFFWSATPAVIVFFVLSGFVLSLPYYNQEKKTPNYLKFFIKRILRLYIPCLIIITLSLLLKSLLYQPNVVNSFGDWVKEMWVLKRNPRDIIDLFLLNTHFNDIDSALWTLPIELKLSLILPFFIFIQKRLNLFWSMVVVLACAVSYHILYHLKLQNHWSDFVIMYYFSFFALGSFVCKYKKAFINLIDRLPVTYFIIFVFCSVVIYTYQYSLWFIPNIDQLLKKPENYIYGLSGTMFLMIALSKQAHSLFNSKLLLFFGKYSFSLYLIHQVVIVTFAYILCAFVNIYLIIALAFVASVALSVGYYKLVEIPAQNLGKVASEYTVSLFTKKHIDKK